MNSKREPEKRGITLFKVFGIRITLDLSWFIVFTLVFFSLSAGYFPRNYPGQETQTYWLAGFAATLLFFASVLIHELSHSVMAQRCGIDIPEITLFIFGGVSRLAEEPKDPQTELKISLVGPLSSFILALIFWVVRAAVVGLVSPLMTAIFEYLAWINVALGVFNLIPGFPLDGGRALRAAYWWRTGSLTHATKLASDIGQGFAVALMVLGGLQIFAGSLIGGLWFLFIGMFLRGMSARGYQELVTRLSLEHVKVRETMIRDVVSVSAELSLARLVHDYFLHYTYRGFPVMADGKVVGMVSVDEVRRVAQEEQESTRVANVMSPLRDGLLIVPEATLADALRQMVTEEEDRLLVMEKGAVQGMITRTGVGRFVELKQVLEGERG